MNPLKELEGFDAGRQLALMKKLGGRDVVDAILRDEVYVKVKEAIRILFDKHGRRIPEGLRANVRDSNRKFRLDQPGMTKEVHYANRIMRLHGKLGVDTGITTEQLQQETERLLALVRDDSQVANITNGVWLPVILVKRESDDLGTELERYLEAVGKSYIDIFPDRKFYNHRKGELADQVSIMNGSRYESVWERKKSEYIPALFFPNPLQGFSINASREQMETLPEGFVLSGLDTAIAVVMYPDVLTRGYYTPSLDLAALSWQSPGYSLCFGAFDGGLDFARTGTLASAFGSCSGGLLFLG